MPDRNGTGVGLAVALGVLSVMAVILSQTGPQPSARFAGIGATVTEDQPLTEGWYRVAWSASTGGRPSRACLVGLRLDQTATDASPGPREYPQFFYRVPKLVYQTLPARRSLTGSSGPVRLDAGRYRLIAEGWCRWEVSILSSDPAPTPSNNGGPRM